MRLQKLKINGRFKNLDNFEIDFSLKEGITVLIGNNGSGKSNILEAVSSIFAGLYNNKYNPNFNYILSYTKDTYNVEIIFENKVYEVKINGIVDNLKPEHLPSQLISSYSGEESRLWIEYYEPFYQDYIKAIRGASLPKSNLVYINKYYWNIALLVFHFYDFDTFSEIKDFCKNTLGIDKINYIKFSFDIQKLKNWQPNPITNFVNTINPTQAGSIIMTLNDLKNLLKNSTNEIEFFRYISAAHISSNDKLITNIEININDNFNSDCLSEGEKKLLLVKLILEVISDENSLILLDEPDSHIHVSRKQELNKMLLQYRNRENIITTHSPTLAHHFENKYITMISRKENGDAQIENSEKQEIVHKITCGIWSYMDQNIFLNSNKDILLVEGKTDEIFLKKALSVLKPKETRYANLDFEYLPCGGADGIKLLVNKFKPKVGQSIIAFFDQDDAGWKCVNSAFNENGKYNSKNFTHKIINDIWIAVYPIRNYFRGSQFNIEDYFTKSLLNRYVFNGFKGLKSINSENAIKRKLERECNGFDDSEFRCFSKVFDLILHLKSLPVATP